MRNVAGIDIGTAFTKAVIIASGGRGERPEAIGRGAAKTGVNLEQAAERALQLAMEEAQIDSSQVSYIATTGFGRYSVSFRDIQITEITSGARGAYYLFPQTAAVLDIGAQSTRAIALKENGRVKVFKTNDKCAAGSGSFIQRAAKYLEVEIADVGEMALRAKGAQPISSVCAVLAESEIINHVSAGVSVEDILRGIYDSLAERAAMLLKRAGAADELAFIGGVANQRGMTKALEDRLGMNVHVPHHAEYICALGAALLGLKRIEAMAHPSSISEEFMASRLM